MKKDLTIPLKQEEIENLQAGDHVLLNGTIYVARDAAHERLNNLINENKKLPIDLQDNIIYYMGPTPTKPNMLIGSCGPTTSHRMDKYTPLFYDLGLKATIGKGDRSQEVINSIIRNKGIYFLAIGGAGAVYQNCVKQNELIAFEDLGPEAIRKLEVENFPVIVAIDSNGNTIKENRKEYRK